jgi:hypothetical protein
MDMSKRDEPNAQALLATQPNKSARSYLEATGDGTYRAAVAS